MTAADGFRQEGLQGKGVIDGYSTNRREQFGERFFNYLITHIPSHTIRQAFLRYFGVNIGRNTSIMMGATILGLGRLVIGNNCSIGFNVVLDARGGLVIDDDVVLASDVHVITARHIIDSDDFGVTVAPVHLKHHAWVASRSTVLQDVTIGVGAVVGACSLVNTDVEDMAIVAGLPAKVRGTRKSTLDYHPVWRPLLY
jgi:putative colanic acid biosynthesis acetyltransferase WcaF